MERYTFSRIITWIILFASVSLFPILITQDRGVSKEPRYSPYVRDIRVTYNILCNININCILGELFDFIRMGHFKYGRANDAWRGPKMIPVDMGDRIAGKQDRPSDY